MGLVVIRHDHDGTFTCSRYGHLTAISIAKDDVVEAGHVIAEVAQPNEFARFEAHLHFDICKTGDSTLIENALHWPKSALTEDDKRTIILAHYQNPASFLQPRLAQPAAGNAFVIVVGENGVNIRSSKSTASSNNIVGWLHQGAVVELHGSGGVIEEDTGRMWLELADGGYWIAEELTAPFDASAPDVAEPSRPARPVTP